MEKRKRVRARVHVRRFQPSWELESFVSGICEMPEGVAEKILHAFADNEEFWKLAQDAKRLKSERDEILKKMEKVRERGVAEIVKRYKRGAK